MDDPDSWRWIWLGAALVFGIGEMGSPGSFFLAPFAIGAVVAAILAFADAPVAAGWAAFVGVSLASFLALRPLARRLDAQGSSEGIGSRRLIGRSGIVLQDVGPGLTGVVRINAEEWRASSDHDEVLVAGTTVLVSEIEGTRVIVSPTKEHTT